MKEIEYCHCDNPVIYENAVVTLRIGTPCLTCGKTVYYPNGIIPNTVRIKKSTVPPPLGVNVQDSINADEKLGN